MVGSDSDQGRGEREGLHSLVPAGQLRVGQGLLGEVWTLLRGLQEQEQAPLPQGLRAVLQTPHQLQRLPQSERGRTPVYLRRPLTLRTLSTLCGVSTGGQLEAESRGDVLVQQPAPGCRSVPGPGVRDFLGWNQLGGAKQRRNLTI